MRLFLSQGETIFVEFLLMCILHIYVLWFKPHTICAYDECNLTNLFSNMFMYIFYCNLLLTCETSFK